MWIKYDNRVKGNGGAHGGKGWGLILGVSTTKGVGHILLQGSRVVSYLSEGKGMYFIACGNSRSGEHMLKGNLTFLS